MNHSHEEQGDVRITSYLLDELSEGDRHAFEEELNQEDDLRNEVETVRETVTLLSGAFAAQSVEGLTSEQRAELVQSVQPGNIEQPAFSRFAKIALPMAALLTAMLLVVSLLKPPSSTTAETAGTHKVRGSDQTEAGLAGGTTMDVRILPAEETKPVTGEGESEAIVRHGTSDTEIEEPQQAALPLVEAPTPKEHPTTQPTQPTRIVEGPETESNEQREESLASPLPKKKR